MRPVCSQCVSRPSFACLKVRRSRYWSTGLPVLGTHISNWLSHCAVLHSSGHGIQPACMCACTHERTSAGLVSLLYCADYPTGNAEIGGYDASTIAILGAAVLFAVTAASLPEASWGLPDPLDTLPWEWNASSVGSYWSRRPVAVARRSVAVTFAGLTVGLGLALDRAAGRCPTTLALLSLPEVSVVPVHMRLILLPIPSTVPCSSCSGCSGHCTVCTICAWNCDVMMDW